MSTAAAAAVQSNPFPGLRPFREDEEHKFFGRESQVDAMVDKLAATHFLAVVGTSGCGKSSLVNSGLRPALHGGLMARAGTAWRMAKFRPGSDPLGAMARALARDDVLFRDYQAGGLTLAEIVDTTLRMSKLGLIDIYEQARLCQDVNLLVVVDQFEELFRYRQIGAAQHEDLFGISEAATAFVNLLLEAKTQTAYPIYVVLTMRSDFLGDCAQFAGLAEAINQGQYLVPRMTRNERRAAISGPVGVGGAEIAPVLLTRLVNDVGDNPDQLSILQHALNRTWARWQNEGGGKGPLDLAHYEAIGTMAHALDQHAEKAYAELGTARKKQICEKLFKALTDKATDPRGIRRPTPLGILCALADATEAEVTEVIDVFRRPSRSFLMPPAGDALETETVIDISHESLMRVWQQLNTWADEEAQSAQIYRRLAETAVLHAAGKASLWRDPDLRLALDWHAQNQPNETWASRYDPGFTAAMGFLTKSSEARAAELAQREEQRRRELEAEQQKAKDQARYARRMRWAALVSGALALVAVILCLIAFDAWDKAEVAKKKAQEQTKIAEFANEKAHDQTKIADEQTEIARARERQLAASLLQNLQSFLQNLQKDRYLWLQKHYEAVKIVKQTGSEEAKRQLDQVKRQIEVIQRKAKELKTDLEKAKLSAGEGPLDQDETATQSSEAASLAANEFKQFEEDYAKLSVCEKFDRLEEFEPSHPFGLEAGFKLRWLAALKALREKSAVVVTQKNLVAGPTVSHGKECGALSPGEPRSYKVGETVCFYAWISSPRENTLMLEIIDSNKKLIDKTPFKIGRNLLKGERLGHRIDYAKTVRSRGKYELLLKNPSWKKNPLMCRSTFTVE